jgi:hypothetical protein
MMLFSFLILKYTNIMLDLASLIRYLVQGMAVATAIYFVLRDRVQTKEILTIGLAAAAAYAVLDTFAPSVGVGARLGTGIGLGMSLLPEGYEQQ